MDPIRKFAAIRVNQYKLVVKQDAVFKTTWYPRYEVTGEFPHQLSTLPGAIIDCGKNKKTECNSDVSPCLFDISKGKEKIVNCSFGTIL